MRPALAASPGSRSPKETAMHAPAESRSSLPYGISFTVADLVAVRDWAARHSLAMEVLLDQVLDGAEFEELLLLRGAGGPKRALTIWRAAGAIIAQQSGTQPLAFTAIAPALTYCATLLTPPPRSRLSGFLRVIGLGV
jgi:hypothetical protein